MMPPQHSLRTSPPSSITSGGATTADAAHYSQRTSPPEPVFVASTGHASSSVIMHRVRSMASSRLRGKLQSGKPAHGIVLSIPSLALAKTASWLGFDFAVIDMEPRSAGLIADMVAAMRSAGACTPLVRVPSYQQSGEWIQWAAEAGAQGVVVPGIQSKDQMWAVVSQCTGDPRDVHSAPPSSSGLPIAHGSANRMLVIPQIDCAAANVEEILAVPGVDAAFVDSAQALGDEQRAAPHGAQCTPKNNRRALLGFHGDGETMIDKVLACGRYLAVPLGIDSASGPAARLRSRQGFQMVAVSDLDVFASAAAEQLRLLRD
ncbi:Pyruvate/Phosphoenolpyruvate kinase-like domain-containing protein [Coemansia spiralis]|nr:Pyruvate/Phosphoenolpyruvate kinase-like domain-containing protein [Coemansia spiralis]